MMKFGTLIDVAGPGRASTKPGFSRVGVPSERRSGAEFGRTGLFGWGSLLFGLRLAFLHRLGSGRWSGRLRGPSVGGVACVPLDGSPSCGGSVVVGGGGSVVV